MSERKIVMGVDTSNYTTSVALMYDDGELIANIKRPLPVKSGECGLRQSDAVFAHVKNIPSVMQEAASFLEGRKIYAIGVSERPRNVVGSYMPCFLSGVSVAESISAALDIPLYKFSHQCGHIMSALYSSGREDLLSGEYFAAFHVSGGTTEMLRVRFENNGFQSLFVGGTADINAGQLIDRVGVSLGVDFPAGPALEQLALAYEGTLPLRKPPIKDFKINLSGGENIAKLMLSETSDTSKVAAFVFDYVGRGLTLLADSYQERFGESEFLFAGGVMCNSIIKGMLRERYRAFFAQPQMSADNAVGIAALTRISYKKG